MGTELDDLYKKLRTAFTPDHLKHLTSWIVGLHREKNTVRLAAMDRKVSRFIASDERGAVRPFFRLIMLVHPDRLAGIKTEIDRLRSSGSIDGLSKFGYIFLLLDEMNSRETIRFEPDPEIFEAAGFSWAFGREDLQSISREEAKKGGKYGSDFLSALEESEYGSSGVETDYGDIEMYDEDLVLSGYAIEGLSGLERFVNLVRLDLSDNRISDLTALDGCDLLEELDLSRNCIEDISSIGNLDRLRVLDLSFNQISDIKPLSDLEELEVVNLEGNDVPETAIKELRDRGVTVV